jgi:Zn-dependent peptidase ImmA (M78 family)
MVPGMATPTVETMETVAARKEACRVAADYARRFWTDSVPVDPVRIAAQLGVRVMQADLPEAVAGAVYKAKGQDPVIIVARDDHPHRQRFTVAHELGHYVRRVEAGEETIDFIDYRDQVAAPGDGDDDEVFANELAACLLMPEHAVAQLARQWKQPDGKPDVLMLASAFKVSEEAVRYRLLHRRPA